jgi:hypothetical protein
MTPAVSLIIKASFQGANLLDLQIRHIVRMLEHKRFCEVILVFDPTESVFIRQYSQPSKSMVLSIAEKLLHDRIIDKYVVPPTDNPDPIEEINKRWFGIRTAETHTITKAPMYQQLYAFEISRGAYILQTDADVIIGRRDRAHDYLSDMIAATESAQNVVSVGFNIAHRSNDFCPYSTPSIGEYVPEVRICLFQKDRFFSLRPFPNELIDGKFKHTWYRSLHQLQKKDGLVSLRGGDGRTFFIHPQNSMKKDLTFLTSVIRKVEENQIPEIQFDHVDLVGSYNEWDILSTKADVL